MIEELKQRRSEIVKKQIKEYRTRGNTQYCQKLFIEIEDIDKQIEALEKGDRHDDKRSTP